MNRRTSPSWLLAPIVLAGLFLLIPFVGIVLRVKWGALFELLATEEALDALGLSLKTCVASTVLCVFFGVPLALWLAQAKDSVFSRLLRTLVTMPMVLPPVVAGLALLITWGRRGLIGQYLSVFGFQIGFTTLAVVFAQTFVAAPFLVTSLEGALRTRGFEFEQAARGLGASPTRTLFSVTLPLSAPAIASAMSLAFSRCLGEFGATITFAGSLQGVTRTMPLEIYLQRETDTDTAIALSLALVMIAFTVLGGTQILVRLWGRQRSDAPADCHTKTQTPAPKKVGTQEAGSEETAGHEVTPQDTKQPNPDNINTPTVANGLGIHTPHKTTSHNTPQPTDTSADCHTKTQTPAPKKVGTQGVGTQGVEMRVLRQKHVPEIHVKAQVEQRNWEVDLTFKAGSVTAVVGPNGAGKSTLVSLIAGTLDATSGGVTFSDTAGVAVKPRIVLLEQKPALFPHMSAVENVVFGLKCCGLDAAQARQVAHVYLDKLGVGHLSHRFPQQLSGGQARRVALARALAIEPDVILLDEPFAALDIEVAQQLRMLMPAHIEGITTVLVTHDLADVKALNCDVVVLRHGSVSARGHWQELLSAAKDPFVDSLARNFLLNQLF